VEGSVQQRIANLINAELVSLLADKKPGDKFWEANIMLLLRALTNLCNSESGKAILSNQLPKVRTAPIPSFDAQYPLGY
jgi:hypothetical protein